MGNPQLEGGQRRLARVVERHGWRSGPERRQENQDEERRQRRHHQMAGSLFRAAFHSCALAQSSAIPTAAEAAQAFHSSGRDSRPSRAV